MYYKVKISSSGRVGGGSRVIDFQGLSLRIFKVSRDPEVKIFRGLILRITEVTRGGGGRGFLLGVRIKN